MNRRGLRPLHVVRIGKFEGSTRAGSCFHEARVPTHKGKASSRPSVPQETQPPEHGTSLTVVRFIFGVTLVLCSRGSVSWVSPYPGRCSPLEEQLWTRVT